jgi:hypothetical protein
MSAFYPPYYSFTGINFNSGFFTTPTTGLTETQANAIYLRKTTPDTASALETFTGGLKTDTINATNPANILTIGASSASTTVSSNLQVDIAINTPSLTTNYVDVENIAMPGILTIGEDFCTSIDIGAVAKPTNIKGALNTTGLTTATGGIKTNTIDVAAASALDIGTTTSTSVNIARGGVSLNVKGSMQCTQQVYPNGGLDTLSSAALNIGTTVTKSGAINIGTGLSRTGIIHIGDGNSVSGAIHIGNGTSASNNVNILNGATSTGSVNIGNNTSGTVIIGGTGAMTLNGAITASTSLTSTGLITANGGITMGGSNNITLGSGAVVPTSAQIGYVQILSSASGTGGVSPTNTNIASFTLPTAGTYIIFCSLATGTVSSYQTVSISIVSATANSQTLQQFVPNGFGTHICLSGAFSNTTAKTIYIVASGSIAASFTNIFTSYVRIA